MISKRQKPGEELPGSSSRSSSQWRKASEKQLRTQQRDMMDHQTQQLKLHNLPSDLILSICFMFSSTHDLLSFALISKRYKQVVLGNDIRDPDNKHNRTLLDAFAILHYSYNGSELTITRRLSQSQFRQGRCLNYEDKQDGKWLRIPYDNADGNLEEITDEPRLQAIREWLRANPNYPTISDGHFHYGSEVGLWTTGWRLSNREIQCAWPKFTLWYQEGIPHGVAIGYASESYTIAKRITYHLGGVTETEVFGNAKDSRGTFTYLKARYHITTDAFGEQMVERKLRWYPSGVLQAEYECTQESDQGISQTSHFYS